MSLGFALPPRDGQAPGIDRRKGRVFRELHDEVAPKSRILLQKDNPQVRQDVKRFMEVKATVDRARRLHEDAKKNRNRLQKRSLRIQAASLLKQAQEKAPELEQVLGQRYPEVKGTAMSRIRGSLRYLEYSLERFTKMVPSQAPQSAQVENEAFPPITPSQNPLDVFLER